MHGFSALLLCFTLLIQVAKAQQADSLRVATLLEEGDTHLFFARYDPAIAAYGSAANLAKGHFPELYLAAMNGAADVQITNARYSPAMILLDGLRNGIDSLGLGDHPQHARFRYLEGKCAAEMGDYALAQEKLAAALAMYQRLYSEARAEAASCIVWQGACYRRTGDFDQAKRYGQRALDMYRQAGEDRHPGIADALNNIGYAWMSQRDCAAADPYYEQALALRRQLFGENHPDVAESLQNMATCLNRAGEQEKALEMLYRSLAIKQKTLSPDHYSLSYSYGNIGSIHQLRREYDLSLEYALKGMKVMQKNFGEYHPALVAIYNNLATRHGIVGEYAPARSYIQKGLMSLDEGFRDTSFYANPSPESIRYEPFVFNLLYSKAMVAQQYYQQVSQDPRDLNLAFETFLLAGEVIDRLRMGYEFRAARQDLTANALVIYEGGIDLALRMYEERQDVALLAQAFVWSEKSKGLSVIEALRETHAQRQGGVPEAILAAETRLQEAIARQEKRLYYFQSETTPAALQLAAACRDSIIRYTTALTRWKQETAQAYPAYYRLKYDLSVIGLSGVQQQLLQPDEAMISWFSGRRSLFAFVILPDSVRLLRLPKARNFSDNIYALRSSIYSYFLTPSPSDSLYVAHAGEFARLARDLHRQLVAPLLPAGLDAVSRWIIVPDGELGYLPFEVLLADSVHTPTAFSSHPYLLKEKQISYAYSATLLRENRRAPEREIAARVLSIAPAFAASESAFASVEAYRGANLGPLLFNRREVAQVRSIAGGKTLENEAATLENFRRLGPKYGILHFATHGKADDAQADFSFLAFSGASKEAQTGLLFARDLYDMKLPAEMVVLSACETGIGKLQKGEGIASLGRGFFFAGARSLIATLWSVNDAKTAGFMESFYRRLRSGMTKDAALRSTKLDHLLENDDFYSHPYFWSGYIAAGDMSPIRFESRTQGYLWAAVGMALLLAGLLFWRRRQRTRFISAGKTG